VVNRPQQTQRTRVLAALRHAGTKGITAVDFLAPNVIDGGPPILGFAARISELGRSHTIVTAGKRDKCKVFRLVEDDADESSPQGGEGSLFSGDVGSRRPRSPYDIDDEPPRRWGA
jgi:hypothetical protein